MKREGRLKRAALKIEMMTWVWKQQ